MPLAGAMREFIVEAARTVVEQELPALIDRRFREDPRLTAVDSLPALDVAVRQKVPQKGRRRVVAQISRELTKACERMGKPVHRDLTGRRLYPRDVVDDWLNSGGWGAIERYRAQVAGQRELRV